MLKQRSLTITIFWRQRENILALNLVHIIPSETKTYIRALGLHSRKFKDLTLNWSDYNQPVAVHISGLETICTFQHLVVSVGSS